MLNTGGYNCIPIFIDCRLEGNEAQGSAGYGGAACNYDEYGRSGLSFINCTLENNSATCDGGGAYNSRKAYRVSLTNCLISGNKTGGNGGGSWNSSLTNCLIKDNLADGGGGGSYGGILTNCTVVNNTASWGGSGAANITGRNTIIAANAGTSYEVSGGTYDYCAIWRLDLDLPYSDAAFGEGCFILDPQFVGGGDYHLQGTSPCCDHASATYAPDDDLDHPGEFWRPQGEGDDIGSYELFGGGDWHGDDRDEFWVDAINGSDLGGDGSEENPWQRITWAFWNIGSLEPTKLHIARGRHDFTLGEVFPLVLDKPISMLGDSSDGTIIDAGAVGAGVIGVFNVDKPTTIANLKITGGGIHFAGGREQGGGVLFKNCTAAVSLENCQISNNSVSGWAGRGGGIYLDHSHPRISHCIISGNTSLGRSAYGGGGGIYCYYSSPEITNCAISGNTGGNMYSGDYGGGGGGIYCYNYSSPVISNCVIRGNIGISHRVYSYYRGGGGGIVSTYYSWPKLVNCLLEGNEAQGENGFGGAACIFEQYGRSGIFLINCTVSLNKADQGAAGVFSYSQSPAWGVVHYAVIIKNSIIASNLGTPYEVVGGHGGECHYSNIWREGEGTPWDIATMGEGCLSQDPQFADPEGLDLELEPDLGLLEGSPCLEAGNNEYIAGYEYDLKGEPRVQPVGGTVDLGCYEGAVVTNTAPILHVLDYVDYGGETGRVYYPCQYPYTDGPPFSGSGWVQVAFKIEDADEDDCYFSPGTFEYYLVPTWYSIGDEHIRGKGDVPASREPIVFRKAGEEGEADVYSSGETEETAPIHYLNWWSKLDVKEIEETGIKIKFKVNDGTMDSEEEESQKFDLDTLGPRFPGGLSVTGAESPYSSDWTRSPKVRVEFVGVADAHGPTLLFIGESYEDEADVDLTKLEDGNPSNWEYYQYPGVSFDNNPFTFTLSGRPGSSRKIYGRLMDYFGNRSGFGSRGIYFALKKPEIIFWEETEPEEE